MLHHTVGVLHLDEERVAIEEVIVVRHNVGVVEDGKDVDFVLRVFALFLAESIQIDLLPDHQGIVLHNTNKTIRDRGPSLVMTHISRRQAFFPHHDAHLMSWRTLMLYVTRAVA